MIRKSCLALLFLAFIGTVAGASVGAIPGAIDYSNVEPGTTLEGELYITTNMNRRFNVTPEASSLTNQGSVLQSDRPSIVSQGGSEDWFEFTQAEVNPNSQTSVTLPDGSSANVNGVSSYTIDVPDDAEPGLHYGIIEPNADITGGEGQPGAITFGETRVRYSILVEGGAQRNIVVQDVRGFRLGEDQAAVEVLLTNRGTVTASTEDFEIDIIDSNRENEATLEANGAMLEPGESQWVEASWINEDGIEEGTYQVDGRVDYLSGQATASGSFSLPGFDVVEVRPADSPGSDEQERSSVPLWLIIMVLILMGVLMWSFGIDPFWILLIVGVLGISAFILMSSISNYLLILLLMVVAIVVYGGL
jgi:hypothetical protein